MHNTSGQQIINYLDDALCPWTTRLPEFNNAASESPAWLECFLRCPVFPNCRLHEAGLLCAARNAVRVQHAAREAFSGRWTPRLGAPLRSPQPESGPELCDQALALYHLPAISFVGQSLCYYLKAICCELQLAESWYRAGSLIDARVNPSFSF